MRRIIAVLLVVAAMLAAVPAWAQTQKDVLRALILMENKCQAGITRRDYPVALADLMTEVKMFSGTEEAKKCPEFTKAANEALEHYAFFGKAVQEAYKADVFFENHQQAAFNAILARYPSVEIARGGWGQAINISALATTIFSAASRATQQAQQNIGR